MPHGKNKETTTSALAATETTAIGRQPGSPRTARAIVKGATTPDAMINKNAMPCTQSCHVTGLPPLSIGISTRNAAKISATPKQGEQHDREAARPPARQPIAHRDGEEDDQQAR